MSKRYKWLLIGMLSCAFFFHQADRALYVGLMTSGLIVAWALGLLGAALLAFSFFFTFNKDRIAE